MYGSAAARSLIKQSVFYGLYWHYASDVLIQVHHGLQLLSMASKKSFFFRKSRLRLFQPIKTALRGSRRFVAASVVSAVASFGVSTWVLNPGLSSTDLKVVSGQVLHGLQHAVSGWSPSATASAGFENAVQLASAAGISTHDVATWVHALAPIRWRLLVPVASVEALLPTANASDSAAAVSPPLAHPTQFAQTQFNSCPEYFPPGRRPVVPVPLQNNASVTDSATLLDKAKLRELCFSGFAILHSGQTKTPVFVAQRLNREQLQQGQGLARTDRFYEEARLRSAERAQLRDYAGSGYSRGHMAPAGDMHTPEAMAQSFSLANMVPQNQRHNAGAWRRIEDDTRKYVMRAPGDVYVFTGPVYEGTPETIGAGKVAVPTHLFKVVYDATSGRSWVHWHWNSPDTKAESPISYPEFVRRTGLHLLPQD